MIDLQRGDCLEILKTIPDKSVDCIIVDPPYGTTQCRWDSIIPIDLMWKQIVRIVKDRAAVCIFGTEPFSSQLRMSNIKMYKYDWVWQKDKPTNHLNAKKQPLRRNELISVFYKKQCHYTPQLTEKLPQNIRPATTKRSQAENYGSMTKDSIRGIPLNMSYPSELLQFRGCFSDKGKSLHPTQKPVDLIEYLLKTYTLKGDTVLDFAMGSGTTGVACKNLNRNFIGIEKNNDYFQTAERRIKGILKPPPLSGFIRLTQAMESIAKVIGILTR